MAASDAMMQTIMDGSIQSIQDRPWYIVQRWQEYRGEVRAFIALAGDWRRMRKKGLGIG